VAATTTFSGIASGIDSASIIKSMMSIASQPITRAQAKQTANNTMSKKFTDIKSKMSALQTAAKSLDTRTEAMVNKATSSKADVLGVSTAGGASLGSFSVTVGSVAQTERTYSDGFASSSATDLFSPGTLTIQVGAGAAVDIDVDASDTLDSVAKKINSASAGVTAGLVFNGSQYRLQVAGNETGTDHSIAFSGAVATSLGLDNPANEFQAASNASVTIDNITVSSQTNAVSGAIPGVTLNVLTTGTSNVTIDRDPDGLKTKIDAFVKAYNDVMTAINAESTASANGVPKAAGSLSGDGTLRSVQSDLRALMSQSLGSSATFATLGAIGVAVQRDGTLSVDSEKLKTAVNKDYEAVTAAFVGVGSDKGLMGQVVDKIEPYVRAGGTITNRITNLTDKNRDIDSQIDRLQLRLDKYEESLQKQYANLESIMGGLQSQGNALAAMLK
jgi:flagellar hook-associated protein 2